MLLSPVTADNRTNAALPAPADQRGNADASAIADESTRPLSIPLPDAQQKESSSQVAPLQPSVAIHTGPGSQDPAALEAQIAQVQAQIDLIARHYPSEFPAILARVGYRNEDVAELRQLQSSRAPLSLWLRERWAGDERPADYNHTDTQDRMQYQDRIDELRQPQAAAEAVSRRLYRAYWDEFNALVADIKSVEAALANGNVISKFNAGYKNTHGQLKLLTPDDRRLLLAHHEAEPQRNRQISQLCRQREALTAQLKQAGIAARIPTTASYPAGFSCAGESKITWKLDSTNRHHIRDIRETANIERNAAGEVTRIHIQVVGGPPCDAVKREDMAARAESWKMSMRMGQSREVRLTEVAYVYGQLGMSLTQLAAVIDELTYGPRVLDDVIALARQAPESKHPG